MEKVVVMAEDGYELDVHIFKAKKPKAVVQIIHGMEEHQERYETFANFLVKNNYTVVSSDMRGHGSSAKLLGHFKDKNGYIDLIQDEHQITKYIKNNFANIPIYIFAHSMGTIKTRVLLQKYSSDYSKVVLSGYPNYQSGAKFGIFVANILKCFHKPTYKSKILENLGVNSFNKKIKNAKTPIDWLSANEDNLKSYSADPLCGFGFTISAFSDLFHLVIKMHRSEDYLKPNTKLKLLMVRGTEDPCTGGEKGAKDSRDVLLRAGFTDLNYIDYVGMRHEILNEKENQKVYNDVLNFYNN